jgi:hypothetical protein
VKLILLTLLLLPSLSSASFLFNYDLNYSSETETSDSDYSKSRTFHKILVGGSLTGRKNLYLGWNINYWNSAIKTASHGEDSYSLTEMGPKVLWFLNENYNWFLGAEWNPYAVGTRTKNSEETDIRGSSLMASIGYRFKLSGNLGMGAGLHYHSLTLSEEKSGSVSSNSSDTISHVMPMIELSFITK